MLRKIIWSFLAFAALLLVWGSAIEPRWLDVTQHRVAVSNLAPAWNGKKIAFISDLQVGMWWGNESAVAAAVDELVRQQPEVVMIGGDFIYHPTDESTSGWTQEDRERTNEVIRQVVDLLAPLTDSGVTVLAVLGNHDYSMGHESARMVDKSAQALETALESIGVRILKNESFEVTINDQSLHFVGIAPYYPDLDDADKALAELADQPRVLFMHNANSIDKTPGSQVDLAIAGHTHGGQIRIPGFPHWSWMSLVPQGPDEVKGDGWIPNYKSGESKLYVNRGIGFSTVPVRINCRPEVSIFELQSL